MARKKKPKRKASPPAPFQRKAPEGLTLQSYVVRMRGDIRRAWLAGSYGAVWELIKAELPPTVRLQSIRLLIKNKVGTFLQKSPLRANVADFEQYMADRVRLFGEGFANSIAGFALRVVVPKGIKLEKPKISKQLELQFKTPRERKKKKSNETLSKLRKTGKKGKRDGNGEQVPPMRGKPDKRGRDRHSPRRDARGRFLPKRKGKGRGKGGR